MAKNEVGQGYAGLGKQELNKRICANNPKSNKWIFINVSQR